MIQGLELYYSKNQSFVLQQNKVFLKKTVKQDKDFLEEYSPMFKGP